MFYVVNNGSTVLPDYPAACRQQLVLYCRSCKHGVEGQAALGGQAVDACTTCLSECIADSALLSEQLSQIACVVTQCVCMCYCVCVWEKVFYLCLLVVSVRVKACSSPIAV